MKKYIYPKLPAVRNLYLFRIGGNGLANCLFVYGKAIVKAQSTGQLIISPTWFNLSIGTYLRKQIDKRHYTSIFTPEINLLRKLFLIIFHQEKIETVSGINDYFNPLKGKNHIIRKYLLTQLTAHLKATLPYFKDNVISIHIRLGDYPVARRTPIDWYIQVIETFKETVKSCYKIYVFSDGTNNELKRILDIEGVERKSYNNAILDMWAMSQAKLIIASDSTFSAWAAYLNQVPVVFNHRHFPPVLDNQKDEIVICENMIELKAWINKNFIAKVN